MSKQTGIIMKLALFVFITIFAINTLADSGYIVKNAEVVRISSSSGNSDIYRLYYTGGSNDTCSGQVRFHLNRAGSEKIFDRTFTLAVTAYASGSKIDIFSYLDNMDCDSAVTIELRK